jgi:hypothetical protein
MKQILFSLAVFAALLPGVAAAQQTAAAQPGQSPEIAQFQKLEDQWSDAVVKHDQYALENLMATNYIDISSTGEVSTRNQQIAMLYERSTPQLLTMEQRVVNVRILEDIAVVDGTYIVKGKLNGVTREDRGIFTHVYQRARGTWVCVHAQRTAVVEQSDQKAAKTPAKKSTAELPFHIPLIHKGSESTQPPPAPGSQPPPG